MSRLYWLSAVGLMFVAVGCGTFCHRKNTGCPPTKAVFVAPPPPTVPGPLVPAGGATFGPPANTFPTAPPGGAATFGAPDAPFPKAPPSISPMGPPKDLPPRFESKWQPGENPDVKPRVQLYAPEAIDKEKPRSGDEPPAAKKPGATFPAIPQFAEVKPGVYSGLRPGGDGLDWLKSNRVNTVVNILMPEDDDAADQKATQDNGIGYIAVKVSPQNLSKDGFDAFIKQIRDSAAKGGVFVYDKDGSLAAPMWYLYLRWGEYLDDDAAQLRARALGLQSNRDGTQREMWLAVQKLLSENNR